VSLLLEALKKAERAKEEAQRRSREGGEPAAAAPEPERKPVLTRDKLPDLASAPIEIANDELAPAPAAARAASPPERPAPVALELEPDVAPAPPRAAPKPAARPAAAKTADSEAAGRASAKKVFEAKFREPNPRLPFYITMGALGVFAIGTVIYFWYQLRPPPLLVNLNPTPQAQSAQAPAAKPAEPAKPAPKLAGKPDFTGVWDRQQNPVSQPTARTGGSAQSPTGPQFAGQAPPIKPELKAAYDAEVKRLADAEQRGEPTTSQNTMCLPQGMPRFMVASYPLEILQTKGQVTIIAAERWAAIVELIDLLVKKGRVRVSDRDSILAALRQREETMSTGIGFGIAIPHASSNCWQRKKPKACWPSNTTATSAIGLPCSSNNCWRCCSGCKGRGAASLPMALPPREAH